MVSGTKKKVVWLVNYYAMPPEFESRHRTIKFAHYLSEMGYVIRIFSSSVLHNMNRNLILDKKRFVEAAYDDLNFVHFNTLPYKNNGLRRFISLFQFHLFLYKFANCFERPDVIIHTALPPFGNLIYFTACKLKAKYIAEVLDLWPESFVDLGLISKKNPILQVLYLCEKWLYKKADEIIFSMEGGKDYIMDRKWDTANGGPIDLKKVNYINNGVDLSDFNQYRDTFKLDDPDLENEQTKKVIYIGSIRLANNLNELIKAAEILKNHKNIKFLLYGDGDDRETLEKYCKEIQLENVIFKQRWTHPRYVPYILSKGDVNILNYKSGSFGKYGGSQSKLFQYLASGKPICSNIKMMYCLINKYNLGVAKEFTSNKEYAEAILKLANLEEERLNEIKISSQLIVKEYDYIALTKKLFDII